MRLLCLSFVLLAACPSCFALTPWERSNQEKLLLTYEMETAGLRRLQTNLRLEIHSLKQNLTGREEALKLKEQELNESEKRLNDSELLIQTLKAQLNDSKKQISSLESSSLSDKVFWGLIGCAVGVVVMAVLSGLSP